MALDGRIHYKSFARIELRPELDANFWPNFFDHNKIGLNFDGELLGLGKSIEELKKLGFKHPIECFGNALPSKIPEWLERVEIVPHDKAIAAFVAFKLKNSRCDFVQCQWTSLFFVEGVNCEWIKQHQ